MSQDVLADALNNAAQSQKNTAQSNPKLTRRQVLQRMGAGSAAALILPSSLAYGAYDGQSPVTPSTPSMIGADHCTAPRVETRLFASSNAGAISARNRLALMRIKCAGFDVKNPDITERQYLRFAGTDSQRISDLQNLATGAIPAPKLLLGVRGGYGAMRVLPHVDWQTLGRIMRDRGTILAGFSDVTAIQCALLAKGGMSSLAAPMLYSEFGKVSPDKISSRAFVRALTEPNLTIKVDHSGITNSKLPAVLATSQQLADMSKSISGTLWGGNLSVISALAGSPYVPKIKGGMIFLEDVGEQPYRIERMLYDLYLAGVFEGQQAIVFGALSGGGTDSYDARFDTSVVIQKLHQLTQLPIFTGMPFGHIAKKQSFPLGATCQITLDNYGGYQLSFSDYPTIEAAKINASGLWQAAPGTTTEQPVSTVSSGRSLQPA